MVSHLATLPGWRLGMVLQSMLATMSVKHVVGQVIDVVPHAVVGNKKCRQVLPIVFVWALVRASTRPIVRFTVWCV
jgi:hypothetical protein